MNQITGMYLIFTRAERKYSRQRRTGFQTFYHSPELQEEDVKFIEGKVRCFVASDDHIERYQFFRTPSGLCVVTYTILIEPDPEIIDPNERPGAFIATCGAFTAEQFARAGNNPFCILNALPKLADAHQMIERFPLDHDPDPLIITVGEDRFHPKWSAQRENLVLHTREAGKRISHGESLLFYGNNADIKKVLESALAVALPTDRLNCTFNSHIQRCNVKAGEYWAVGNPDRKSSGFEAINVADKNLGNARNASDSADVYLQWLRYTKNSPETAKYVTSIQAIVMSMDAEQTVDAQAINQPAAQSFVNANWDIVSQRLANVLGRYVGRDLAVDLVNSLLADPRNMELAAQTVTGQSIVKPIGTPTAEWAMTQLLPQADEVNSRVWNGIKDLGNQTRHPVLMFLGGYFTNDDTLRRHALSYLGVDDYALLLKQAGVSIPLWAYISPEHVGNFLQQWHGHLPKDDRQFVQLLIEIARTDNPQQLDNRFHQRLLQINDIGLLKRLLDNIQGTRGLDQSFHSLITKQLDDLKQDSLLAGNTGLLIIGGGIVGLVVVGGIAALLFIFVFNSDTEQPPYFNTTGSTDGSMDIVAGQPLHIVIMTEADIDPANLYAQWTSPDGQTVQSSFEPDPDAPAGYFVSEYPNETTSGPYSLTILYENAPLFEETPTLSVTVKEAPTVPDTNDDIEPVATTPADDIGGSTDTIAPTSTNDIDDTPVTP